MPIKTQWFRDRLADRKMSQRALAKQLGLDSSAVSLMFRGKREMKISEAIEIARLLGRTPDEVIEAAGADMQNSGQKVMIDGFMDASGEVHLESGEREFVPHPGGDLPAEIRAARCQTAGSPLEHMDGWLLFGAPVQRSGVQAEAIGRLSFCRFASSGMIYIAKPSRGYQRGRWNLDGPAGSAKDVDLEWAVPVLLIQP